MSLVPPISIARGVNTEPLLIATFCVLWSLAFGVGKLALADCPPLLLVTIRLLVAGVIMLGIATMLGAKRRLGWRDGLVLAALGVVNSASYLSFSLLGMRLVPAGLMALIVSTNPVLTALLAASFLGERMTVRKITGLTLGVAGVAIVVESQLAGGTSSALGIGFAVAALLSMTGARSCSRNSRQAPISWPATACRRWPAVSRWPLWPSRSKASATLSRPGALSGRWPTSFFSARSPPISYGSAW